MKPIKNVTIIGMGALGTLFGYEIQSKIGRENVAFLMDEARCEKNKTAVYKVNGEPFDFRIISPKEAAGRPGRPHHRIDQGDRPYRGPRHHGASRRR